MEQLKSLPATRAFIHLENFDHNIRVIREKIGTERKICLPIKANAYGHGSLEIAERARKSGIDYFAVALLSEAIFLRSENIDLPILILNHILPEEIPEAIKNKISLTAYTKDYLDIISNVAGKIGLTATVHLKIDTGMHRVGAEPTEGIELVKKIDSDPVLCLEGIFTHFSCSDSVNPEDRAYSEKQLNKFKDFLVSVKNMGIDYGIAHAANSGAIATLPESYFDMVRPGIALYGYEPCPECPLGVRPLMEIKSRIIEIKRIEKGEPVSYGRTWTAPSSTYLGVIPIGYGDGINRLLSNRGRIFIEDKSYPIVGRICMDQLLIDLGDKEPSVKIYDEVNILSPKGYHAGNMADDLKTIPYEITSGLNLRVPRLFNLN